MVLADQVLRFVFGDGDFNSAGETKELQDKVQFLICHFLQTHCLVLWSSVGDRYAFVVGGFLRGCVLGTGNSWRHSNSGGLAPRLDPMHSWESVGKAHLIFLRQAPTPCVFPHR